MTDVRYSCPVCGVSNRAVTVPGRKEEEDAVDWFKAARKVVIKDHRKIKPRCRAGDVTDITLPRPGDDQLIGQA